MTKTAIPGVIWRDEEITERRQGTKRTNNNFNLRNREELKSQGNYLYLFFAICKKCLRGKRWMSFELSH